MEQTISSRPGRAGRVGLSYKFQRLREKIRQAIASGELHGKLPGERLLARRFHVNAKTLSKALTDLAAEGVLDRSIGRGTYIKGSVPAAVATRRWLVLCDANQTDSPLLQGLQAAHPDLDVAVDVANMRPSFLNQFAAVIDLADQTPQNFLRDMVVRNLLVLAVGREPRTYSTHAVLFDTALAASHIVRELMLAGHRRIAVLEQHHGSAALIETLRKAATYIDAQAVLELYDLADLPALLENGFTAVASQTPQSALEAKHALESLSLRIPQHLSLVSMGIIGEQAPCSGSFVTVPQVIEAIDHLLNEQSTLR